MEVSSVIIVHWLASISYLKKSLCNKLKIRYLELVNIHSKFHFTIFREIFLFLFPVPLPLISDFSIKLIWRLTRQLTLIFWARSLKPLSRYLPRIKIWRVLVSNTILWQDLGDGPPSFSVSMDKSFHLTFTISNAQKSAKSRFPSHPPKRYSTYKIFNLCKNYVKYIIIIHFSKNFKKST